MIRGNKMPSIDLSHQKSEQVLFEVFLYKIPISTSHIVHMFTLSSFERQFDPLLQYLCSISRVCKINRIRARAEVIA